MISKPALLSASLIVGGGVAVYALSHSGNSAAPVTTKTPAVTASDVARPAVEPLTTDIKTEQQILEQQKREREARTQAQEQQTQALLEDQERVKQLAITKAQMEAEAIKAKQAAQAAKEEPAALTVETRPEALAIAQEEAKQKAAQAKAKAEAKAQAQKAVKASSKPESEKPKTQVTKSEAKKPADKELSAKKDDKTPAAKAGRHTVARGDTFIKLSHQYNVPVSVIAKANNMSRNDALPTGKTIKIPSKSEIAKLQQDIAKESKKETADNKKDTKEKSGAKSVPTHYSVQVAMADNQEKANALAKQYRAAGYKVVTSRTSKGVRVLVGSERTAEAADTLKTKITKDSRVKTDGAWVRQVDTINP